MSNPWFVGIVGVTTVFFGVKAVLVFPTLLRLIKALLNGSVTWPGPRIFDQDNNLPSDQQSHELSSKYLFRLFIGNALGAIFTTIILGILFYNGFLEMALHTLWKVGYLLFLTFLALTWGVSNSQRAIFLTAQVNRLLTNLSMGGEPQQINGFS